MRTFVAVVLPYFTPWVCSFIPLGGRLYEPPPFDISSSCFPSMFSNIPITAQSRPLSTEDRIMRCLLLSCLCPCISHSRTHLLTTPFPLSLLNVTLDAILPDNNVAKKDAVPLIHEDSEDDFVLFMSSSISGKKPRKPLQHISSNQHPNKIYMRVISEKRWPSYITRDINWLRHVKTLVV